MWTAKAGADQVTGAKRIWPRGAVVEDHRESSVQGDTDVFIHLKCCFYWGMDRHESHIHVILGLSVVMECLTHCSGL